MINCATLLLTAILAQAGPIEVDPATLANRRDLIGKEIVIDDRKRMFMTDPTTLRFHEILLKRTPVVVRLPAEFQYRSSPTAQSVRVQGILRQEGKTLVLNPTVKPQLFASDLKRLQTEVANLSPRDITNRTAWADWAERRGAAYDDDDLRNEAIRLYTEVVALELERADARTPEAVLGLAKKARQHGVPEPEPSALWHLGFRLRMTAAKNASDYDAIAREIGEALPRGKIAANADPTAKIPLYDDDPLNGYRRANERQRATLDRRLWADCVSQSIRFRAAAQPESLVELTAEARTQVPERPEISAELRKRELESAEANVTKLRRAEMLDLARTYREDLMQPEKAKTLITAWLEAKKSSLRPTSADAHTDLAKEYLSLLNDKVTAAELLGKAIQIDPNATEADELFSRLGFVKNKGVWQDPLIVTDKPSSETTEPSTDRNADSYLGLTPAEIRAQLGEPKRVSRIATQGRISLQWTYESGKGTQYIDFLQKIGESQPTVVGRFVLK